MPCIHHGQICRAAQRNWAMDNQIMTSTSKNAQTSAAGNWQGPWQPAMAGGFCSQKHYPKDEMGCPLGGAGRWGVPSLQIKFTNNGDQLPGTCSKSVWNHLLSWCLPVAGKRRNKFNLFLRNICESWQQLNLSSGLGREIQGGQEGLWTYVCLYLSTQCVARILEIVSKILQFPYKLFWSMISKEENGFAPTLEKANWGQGDL